MTNLSNAKKSAVVDDSYIQSILDEFIDVLGSAVHVTSQNITQRVYSEFPDLSDSEFQLVKDKAVALVGDARFLALQQMFG